MEDHALLPQLPPPPAAPRAPPSSVGLGPKRKAQRRLGLPPPPPPSSIGFDATAAAQVSAAAVGDCHAAPPSGFGTSQSRKRPPSNSSIASARKARATMTSTLPLQPASSIPSAFGSHPNFAILGDLPVPPIELDPVSPCAQQVLSAIPESMDDESFLNIMNEQAFGSHTNSALDADQNAIDEDIGSDPDDETVLPKKKGSRGVNFTVVEDETVVKAWQAITLDPITGDEQNGATYWKHIYDHFQRNNNSGIFRSQISVTHRWQIIQTSCSKWASCLEQVEWLNPSGANAQDKVNIAQQLYKGKPKKGGKAGKTFALQHCWVLLEHHEKWRTRNNDVPTKSKKSSNSCSLVDDNHMDHDDSDDDDDSDGRRSPTPSSAAPTKRPPGRKAEKEKSKKGAETIYKESLDNMVLTRKELAAERKEFKTSRWTELKQMQERMAAAEERRAVAEERRAAVEERRAATEERAKRLEQEQRLMFMDPTNLDEKGRAYFELLRDQVLVTRNTGEFYMGGFMGGFGADGGNGSSTFPQKNGSSTDLGGNGTFGGNESSTDVGGDGSK